MAFLGDLQVRLKAETADFQQDLGRAAASAERSMRQIHSAAAAMGASLSGGALVALVKHAVDAADKLNDLSKATAVSAVDLGGLGYAASQSGSSLDGIAKAFGKMNIHIAEAKSGNAEMLAVFQNLGVSLKDLQSLTSQQIFGRIADTFSTVEDSANKAAHGNKLFGKSYMDILPTLDEGSAKILQSIEYYKLYSGVTDELVRKSDEFNDQLAKLRLLSGALGMALATELIGPMKGLVDEMVRMKEKSDSATTSAKAVLEVFKAMSVLALEVKFPFEMIGKDMARAMENMKLIATGDFAGSRNLGRMFAEEAARARKDQDAMIARIMALGQNPPQLATGATAEDSQPGAIPKRGDLPDLPKDYARLEALQKRQIASLQQMEDKRRSLLNLSEEQVMLERLTVGTYADYEDPVAARLLNMAVENDTRKQLIERIEAEYGARRALIERVQQDEALQQQSHLNRVLQNEDLKFSIELLGKSARTQELLTAARQADLATNQRIRDRAGVLAADALGDHVAKIIDEEKRLGEAQKENVLMLLQVRQDAERTWEIGARAAMTSYSDNAMNAALQAQMAWQNAFKGMEDALVQFVKTGKLDFKSLADSIITDLIRIQVQRSVTGPLSDILSKGIVSIVGSIFTGGAVPPMPYAEGGTFSAGNLMLVGERGPELIVPDVAGRVIPNHELGGREAGPIFNVDMRGASVEAVQRLERLVVNVNGSIESRAVNAILDYKLRGGGY